MRLLKMIMVGVCCGSVVHGALVVDDFSSYGSLLSSGESGPGGGYTWTVTHSVPGYSHELPISGGQLKLAGFSHPTHPGTIAGEALATYTGTKPVVSGYELSFDFHEYHDLIKLEIIIEGADTHTVNLLDYTITYPASGTASFLFGSDRVTESVTGHADREILYSSIGSGLINPADSIQGFRFTGIHRNNGNDVAEISNLQTTAVPEPAVVGMIGLVTAGLLFVRRVFLI